MRPRDVTRAARAPRRFPNPHPAPARPPLGAPPPVPPAALTFLLGILAALDGRRVRGRTCHGAAAARTAATRRGGGGRTGWNRIGARPPLPRASPPAGPPPAPIGCAARRRPCPGPRIGAATCHSAASPRPPGPSLGGRDPGRGAGRSRPTPLGSLFEADCKSAVCALIRGGVSRGAASPSHNASGGWRSPVCSPASSPAARLPRTPARGVCSTVAVAGVRQCLGEVRHEMPVDVQARAGADKQPGRWCRRERGAGRSRRRSFFRTPSPPSCWWDRCVFNAAW